jgi:hypothetical protein
MARENTRFRAHAYIAKTNKNSNKRMNLFDSGADHSYSDDSSVSMMLFIHAGMSTTIR